VGEVILCVVLWQGGTSTHQAVLILVVRLELPLELPSELPANVILAEIDHASTRGQFRATPETAAGISISKLLLLTSVGQFARNSLRVVIRAGRWDTWQVVVVIVGHWSCAHDV
jgi:hypothetical protein